MKTPAVAAAIALATLVAFLPSLGHPFVMYDDPAYVTDNARILRGITADGVRAAFVEGSESNWHPLTWISHMVDVSLFGVSAPPMRCVNVALHAASAAILFLLLAGATRAVAPSAFAALVFALHPLRVESVVWISERKDVLCVFFSMLATAAYVRYARAPGPGRYGLVAAAFACALASRPMADAPDPAAAAGRLAARSRLAWGEGAPPGEAPAPRAHRGLPRRDLRRPARGGRDVPPGFASR